MLWSGCSIIWEEMTCGVTGYKCLKWEQRERAWAFFCVMQLDLLFLDSYESQIHWVNFIVRASLTSVIIVAGCAKRSKSTKSLLNHMLNSLSWIFPHEYSLCPCKCIALAFTCNHYLGFFHYLVHTYYINFFKLGWNHKYFIQVAFVTFVLLLTCLFKEFCRLSGIK